MELSAIERLKNTPIHLYCRQWRFHLFLVVFNLILLILAGNRNMRQSLDKFEFRPNLTNELQS